MRIATYNIEWMDRLFDEAGGLLLDDEWSSRYNVTRKDQLHAIAHVFNALDADAVMIIEAPDHSKKRDTVLALENFADHFSLRTRKAVIGFGNDTQQEIALLYDPDIFEVNHTPHESPQAPRFDQEFNIDLDIDDALDQVRFSKPPLELTLRSASGFGFEMIGVHMKSKAPHGAKDKQDAMRLSIANRRKQLAQAVWLRRRITNRLEEGRSLLVMGDMNDGPGLDQYEALFGHSSVEVLMGDAQNLPLFDPHAQMGLCRKLAAIPTTSRFFLRHEKRYLQALLDYIMVSEDIKAKRPNWRIWHPLEDPECWSNQDLRTALLTASDHFPVSINVTE